MKTFFFLALSALLILAGCKSNPGTTAPASPSGNAYGNHPGYTGRSSESDYVEVAPVPPSSGGSSYQAPSYSSSEPAYAPSSSSGRSGASSSASGSTHSVQRGDTLYSLSRRYGTSVAAIKSANNLTSDVIRIGQVLRIP